MAVTKELPSPGVLFPELDNDLLPHRTQILLFQVPGLRCSGTFAEKNRLSLTQLLDFAN